MEKSDPSRGDITIRKYSFSDVNECIKMFEAAIYQIESYGYDIQKIYKSLGSCNIKIYYDDYLLQNILIDEDYRFFTQESSDKSLIDSHDQTKLTLYIPLFKFDLKESLDYLLSNNEKHTLLIEIIFKVPNINTKEDDISISLKNNDNIIFSY